MLEMVETAPQAEKRRDAAFDVEIAAVATALPSNVADQVSISRLAQQYYPQFAHMEALYSNAGVETRRWCQPIDWYLQERSWEERTTIFQRHALDLLEQVALDAVDQAGLRLDQIDAIVTNTITGLAIPSLDAMLMNRLEFAAHTERLPIFGLGCGGGVAGLGRATRVAQTMPGGNVLFLTVDLCSLCMRINDPSIAMFVSVALFGDGAAGVVLRNTATSNGAGRSAPRVSAIGEHFWRDTERIMGWDIRNDGFGVVLSPYLPGLMRDNLREAVDGFLGRNGLRRQDFDGFLLHPGGSKIVDVAEKVLDLPPEATVPSREVLRKFGNMSSATAMFVLQYALQNGLKGRHLLAAFGPGFSAYFAVVDL